MNRASTVYRLASTAAVFAALIAVSCQPQSPNAKLAELADRFVQQELDYDPTLSYSSGLPANDQSRFADRTPKSLANFYGRESEDLAELRSINRQGLSASSRPTYANLQEQLESDLQLRVCRTEFWNVNHFNGWQSDLVQVAQRQPVASEDDRSQALRRWNTLPHYVDVEIANLNLGLARGYSAPQSVVRRVIRQMGELAPADPEKSPFWSPAARSNDPAFKVAFRTIILEQINPALRRYRDHLQKQYLSKAREGVAIFDLPHGLECYQAFLRANTTLTRTPRQVFELGKKTVDANTLAVAEMGEKDYGSSDIATIVAAIKRKPQEHFHSRDDLLVFSRESLTRSKQITAAKLIDVMPKQDVVILPSAPFEESAGVGSRFVQEPNPEKPAVYLIKLGDWASVTRAEAEIATVHETVPGHYLQKALARALQPPTALAKFMDNSAYSEGWARHAEAMGEEAHIYDTGDAAILRRLWPARGMVVDPGLNAYHWTRQQAIDYIVASGRFTPEDANDYVDRIAVMPGQLTSYDTGALVIESLREEAEARLGSRFDLRQFNRAVLDEGVVPLTELQLHVESWIKSQATATN